MGNAHHWGSPDEKNGYITRYFPNSTEYSSTITFRHLLSHTSGLSREPKHGDLYPVGGSRTDSPICPPEEPGGNQNNPNGNENNQGGNQNNQQGNQNQSGSSHKDPNNVKNQKEPPSSDQSNQNINYNKSKPQVNLDGTNKTITTTGDNSNENNQQESQDNQQGSQYNQQGSQDNQQGSHDNQQESQNNQQGSQKNQHGSQNNPNKSQKVLPNGNKPTNQKKPIGKHENPKSVEHQKQPPNTQNDLNNNQNESKPQESNNKINETITTVVKRQRRDLNITLPSNGNRVNQSSVRQKIKTQVIKIGFPPQIKKVGYPPVIINGGQKDPNVINNSLDEKILGKENKSKEHLKVGRITNGGKNKNDLDERIMANKNKGMNLNNDQGKTEQTPVKGCDPNIKEKNWLAWTNYIIPYMMPACGYKKYNDHSQLMSCLPGTYFHNSNAGYSILAYALNSYLIQNNQPPLEEWIKENIFKQLGMNDTAFTWADLTMEQKSRTAHGCNLGKNYKTCDPKRPITDFADRGFKTMSSGMWSTVGDLARFQIRLTSLVIPKDIVDVSNKKTDRASEDADGPTKPHHEQYNFGFYLNTDYTCTRSVKGTIVHGAWGDVPGYSAFMTTNLRPKKTSAQYAVVILRTQNYEKRINIGNQGRRLLWRLMNPMVPRFKLKCPVTVYDSHKNGDLIV